MTELVVIAPIPHLRELKQYHNLALMHLMDDPEYKSYYQWCSDMGRYVILDNSQHEKYNYDIRELVRVAEQIGAKEIVIPDAVGNKDLTVERARVAFTLMLMDSATRSIVEGLAPAFMLVPQGSSLGSVLRCIHELSALYEAYRDNYPKVFTRPMTIGFPVQSCGYYFKPIDLPHVTATIKQVCEKHGYAAHILGWDSSPFGLVPPMCADFAFRSVDTSKPYTFALHENDVPFTKRRREIDFFTRRFTDGELERARSNVAEFQAYLNAAETVRKEREVA